MGTVTLVDFKNKRVVDESNPTTQLLPSPIVVSLGKELGGVLEEQTLDDVRFFNQNNRNKIQLHRAQLRARKILEFVRRSSGIVPVDATVQLATSRYKEYRLGVLCESISASVKEEWSEDPCRFTARAVVLIRRAERVHEVAQALKRNNVTL